MCQIRDKKPLGQSRQVLCAFQFNIGKRPNGPLALDLYADFPNQEKE